ncbi:helix-turn-helix transcriptional regulator [Nocardioides acrostichi]|uniref:WYL domain-containing protein n=1 Tax=Nocardioides acrostichi TaxID=2784339 RepID=A0A930Y754_9ACTN|nr:WYL domain-containing protein [Nocardioides acrostichi]MBF4163070.1 WYL domain-containing protein [Nocardioides acrostichi]
MSGQSGAGAQVGRLLALVPYLYSRDRVRLADAADHLGTTPKQVLADLRVLFLCGLPGGYPDDLIDVDLDGLADDEGRADDDGVVSVSNADYLARPLRLNPTEATAIVVALRALRAGADADTLPVLDRALAKVEGAAAEGSAAAQVDPGLEGPDVDEARLEARLRQAVEAGRQVRLTYFVPTRDEESERVVDPRGLSRTGGALYLDAYCHRAEAPRLFRLDRIRRAEVLDTPVRSEPSHPRDLSEGALVSADDAVAVTLRIEPAAAWIVDYYAVDDVRPARDGAADGVLEVDLRVADARWLTRFLLRLAPAARVLGPLGFTEDSQAAASATLLHYRS